MRLKRYRPCPVVFGFVVLLLPVGQESDHAGAVEQKARRGLRRGAWSTDGGGGAWGRADHDHELGSDAPKERHRHRSRSRDLVGRGGGAEGPAGRVGRGRGRRMAAAAALRAGPTIITSSGATRPRSAATRSRSRDLGRPGRQRRVVAAAWRADRGAAPGRVLGQRRSARGGRRLAGRARVGRSGADGSRGAGVRGSSRRRVGAGSAADALPNVRALVGAGRRRRGGDARE